MPLHPRRLLTGGGAPPPGFRKSPEGVWRRPASTARASTATTSCVPSNDVSERLRQPLILEFDPQDYPFADVVREILGLPAVQDLRLLHRSSLGTEMLVDKSGASINYYQSKWNRDRDKTPAERGAAFERFDELYRKFLRNVISPSIEGNDLARVVFQRAPTLRVYPPGGETAMGAFHCDENYHHQPSELNLWMPLSLEVSGTNSLWVESAPGLGDYKPLELRYGQCFRGYLNKCRHGCHPNNSNITRVSLDFRVVCDALGGHNPGFRKGVRRGPKAKYQSVFDIGGFYDVL